MARLSDKNKNLTAVPSPQSPDAAGFIAQTSDETVPNGWLECNGQAVSRTEYAELFALIGTTYGAGDGSTTFNLPTTGTWIDYSSQITPSANSTISAHYFYDGANMEIHWNQTASGASTADNLVLPTGFAINTAVTGTSTNNGSLARGTFLNSGVAFHEAIGKYATTTSLSLRYDNGTSLAGLPALSNGDDISLVAKFPVTL